MCVAFILWKCLEDHAIVIAFNRDEAFHRATLSAHWWKDKESIVGGRDGVGGGTWLLSSVEGRIAFLTNVRSELILHRTTSIEAGRPTRGTLPVDFVEGTMSPRAYGEMLMRTGHQFPGFNLIVVHITKQHSRYNEKVDESMFYITNQHRRKDEDSTQGFGVPEVELEPLPPGIYGISNAPLNETTDEAWPKVAYGKKKFKQLVDEGAFDGKDCPFEEIFSIMSDATQLHRPDNLENVPNTGYGVEFEAAASSIFVRPIQLDGYEFGTRSITVLAVRKDGSAELRERCLNDGKWTEEKLHFKMKIDL